MLAQGQTARAIMVFVRAAAIVVLVVVKKKIGLTDVLVVDLVSTSDMRGAELVQHPRDHGIAPFPSGRWHASGARDVYFRMAHGFSRSQ